jgi:hypothetical protein
MARSDTEVMNEIDEKERNIVIFLLDPSVGHAVE